MGLRIGDGAGKEAAGGQARGLMRAKQRAHSLRLYDPHYGSANPPIHLSVCLSIHLPILLTFAFIQLSVSFP